MSDILSVLSHQSINLTKTWLPSGEIIPYGKAKTFTLERKDVSSLEELCDLLNDLAERPKSVLIRGKPRVEGLPEVHRDLEYFSDQPLHTLMLDIDGFSPSCDPLAEPEKACCEFTERFLPEAFHAASFVWQLSGSMGTSAAKGVLKAHLWFWLKDAANSSQVKAWSSAEAPSIDKAPFNPVQCHYTAKPIFVYPLADPVGKRIGLCRGEWDDVEIDLSGYGKTEWEKTRSPGVGKADLAELCKRDAVVRHIVAEGLMEGFGKDGQLHIKCPWESEHSHPSKDPSETSYFPAGTGGYECGHFHCFHNACINRTDGEFLQKLDIYKNEFEPLAPNSATELTVSARAKSEEGPKPGRFIPMPLAQFRAKGEQGYLIKDIIPRAEVGAIYGASGSGKSFLAIDMAFAVAMGKPWNGKRTRQGKVIYVCAEGAGGFRNRIDAWAIGAGIDMESVHSLPFSVIANSPNLLNAEQSSELIASVKSAGGCDLLIIDTLAQCTPGANENAAEHMSIALLCCKKISEATGGMVMLVHHAGKDVERGMRGWSGLKGAMDCSIEVTRDGENRCIHIEKLKEGEDGATWRFALEKVMLRVDADGDPVTSCYIRIAGEGRAEDRYGKGNDDGGDRRMGKIKRRLLNELRKVAPVKRYEFIETQTEELFMVTGREKFKLRHQVKDSLGDLILDGTVKLGDDKEHIWL